MIWSRNEILFLFHGKNGVVGNGAKITVSETNFESTSKKHSVDSCSGFLCECEKELIIFRKSVEKKGNNSTFYPRN